MDAIFIVAGLGSCQKEEEECCRIFIEFSLYKKIKELQHMSLTD